LLPTAFTRVGHAGGGCKSGTKIVKKLCVPAIVAGLLLSSVTAFALDRVQGVVQRVDTTANQFTIAVAGAKNSR